MPLAGCRGGAPAGVWGNAPTVCRVTSEGNALNPATQALNSEALSAQHTNFARPQTRPPTCSFPQLNIVAPDGRDHIAASPHLALASPLQTDPTPKRYKKTSGAKPLVFQSPEIFTSSAPPDESAGTSARSPQTRTLWGAVHAARDSAPTGRSKAECSAPATIG